MKKWFAIIAAILLVLSLSVAVFADPSSGPGDEHNTATVISQQS